MMKSRMIRTLFAGTAISLWASAAPVGAADDVTDAIEQALQAYNDKDYSLAVGQLDTASQLIRQARADALAELLPDAPSGWTAEEPESSAQSMGAYSMVTAQRQYRKGDETSVRIEIQTDSPFLQQVMAFINTPMMAASSGAKLQIINKQKALVQYDAANKSGNIQIVVGGVTLVKIEGNEVSEADLKAFVGVLDFAKLAQ